MFVYCPGACFTDPNRREKDAEEAVSVARSALQRAAKEHAKKLGQKLDADGDGDLQKEFGKNVGSQLMARLDVDGDGELDEAEIKVGRESLQNIADFGVVKAKAALAEAEQELKAVRVYKDAVSHWEFKLQAAFQNKNQDDQRHAKTELAAAKRELEESHGKADCVVWWKATPMLDNNNKNRECTQFAPLCMSFEGYTKYIASGGFADVFLGTNQVNGETVAVKVLKNTEVKKISDRQASRINAFFGRFPIQGERQLRQKLEQMPAMKDKLSEIEAKIQESQKGADEYVHNVRALGLCIVGTGLPGVKVVCELDNRLDFQLTRVPEDDFNAKYSEMSSSQSLDDALNAMKAAHPVLEDDIQNLIGNLAPITGANGVQFKDGAKTLHEFLHQIGMQIAAQGVQITLGFAQLKAPVPNELYLAVRVNEWVIDEYTGQKEFVWMRTVPVKAAAVTASDGMFAGLQQMEDSLDGWTNKNLTSGDMKGVTCDQLWVNTRASRPEDLKQWTVQKIKNIDLSDKSSSAGWADILSNELGPYLPDTEDLAAVSAQMTSTLETFEWSGVEKVCDWDAPPCEEVSEVFIFVKPTSLRCYQTEHKEMIEIIEFCDTEVQKIKKAIKEEIEVDKTNNAMLKHKNIVRSLGGAAGPLWELGCENKQLPNTENAICIYMENMPGGSLADVLSLRATEGLMGVPEHLIKAWLPQVLCGLQYLHSNGVLHRDLKAENVLVSADMETVKIADFGSLTKVAAADDFISGAVLSMEMFEGWTMAYMPPEFFLMMPFNTSSDIWAVGCLLIELWSGRLGAALWELRGKEALSDPDDCSEDVQVIINTLDPGRSTVSHIIATLAAGGHPPLSDEMNSAISNFAMLCFIDDPDKRPTVSCAPLLLGCALQ